MIPLHGFGLSSVSPAAWGTKSPFAAAGMIACCARQICAKSHPIIARCLEGPFRIPEQSGTGSGIRLGRPKDPGRVVSEAAGCDDSLDHLYARNVISRTHTLRHACGYVLANAGHDRRALQAWKNPRFHTFRALSRPLLQALPEEPSEGTPQHGCREKSNSLAKKNRIFRQ